MGNGKSGKPRDYGFMKKPIHALAAIMGVVGIIIALVVAFMVNGTIDNLENSTMKNLNSIDRTLSDLEVTVENAEEEVKGMDSDLEVVGSSMEQLAGGVKESGRTIGSIGNELSVLTVLGADFGQYSQGLNQSGEELVNAAGLLEDVSASLTGKDEGLSDIGLGLQGVKQNIKQQRSEIRNLKNSLKSTFDTLRLVNILFFLLIAIILGVPLLNALAGII